MNKDYLIKLLRKIALYGKLSLLILALLVFVLFMFSNSERVTVRFLAWPLWQAPLFALVLTSASLGATMVLLTKLIIKLIKDLRNDRGKDIKKEKLPKVVQEQKDAK